MACSAEQTYDYSLKNLQILFGAAAHAGGEPPAQDALSGAGVKIPEHLGRGT